MEAKPKSILSLLCLLAFTSFFTGCGETVISEDQMQDRNDLVYTVNQESPFTGVVVKHYKNGEKEWEKRYKDGIRHGKSTEWFENGQKYEESMYKGGDQDGESTWWFENGQKSEESMYKGGGRDGESTEWFRNGQKKSEGTYKNGEKDGNWTEWHENGQMSSEGSYKDGQKAGMWTEWFQNGQENLVGLYKDGERDGEWSNWYKNGQKKYCINYIKGTKDGSFTLWYENGTTYVNGAYKAGVQDGEWTVWSDYGSKITDWRTSNGNPIDGTVYAWGTNYENYPYPVVPNLEAEYKGGLRSGNYIKRDSNSTIWVEGNFSQGLAIGTWTVYGEDPYGLSRRHRKVIEGNYTDGKRDGSWNFITGILRDRYGTYVAGVPDNSQLHWAIENYAGSLLP